MGLLQLQENFLWLWICLPSAELGQVNRELSECLPFFLPICILLQLLDLERVLLGQKLVPIFVYRRCLLQIQRNSVSLKGIILKTQLH